MYNNGEVKKMEVVAITPRGYCKGVVRAIDIAKKSKSTRKANIHSWNDCS